MEGIEKIKEKIIADANTEIRSINKEIDAQIEEINMQNEGILEEIKKKGMKEKDREVSLIRDKALAQARLKAKRVYNEKRENIISGIIEKGIEQALKSDKYHGFLEKLIKENKSLLEKDLIVYCNERDKDVVSSIIKRLGLNAKVAVSDISGGVILEDKTGKRVNQSLSSVLDRKRDELRHNLISMLG
jgi:V/A-type H+-transporting ATPase subunit E